MRVHLKVKVAFRIQKNRCNGQKITVVADNDHPEFYPVWTACRIFIWAKRLGQSDSQPMAVCVNKQGVKRYLTSNKIADLFWEIAKIVHHDIMENELNRISAHSGWVWALVLLDEAGTSSDFMKSCLCWIGKSYWLYLCDTSILQRKHIDAHYKESKKLAQLLGSNLNILSNIFPADDEMGIY